MNVTRNLCSLLMLAAVSACGATYQLPDLSDTHVHQAQRMFSQAQSETARQNVSNASAEGRFRRVAGRVSTVGKQYCEALTADKPVNCDVDIAIDYKLQQRNAYFTYIADQPVIRISMPMLKDTRSDDEVAFVLGHEYGHLIGRHIEKQGQQAVAGALILGTLVAAANSYSASYGGYYDDQAVSDSIVLGAQAGSQAFSQEYELESDTLGTRIAAAAGYDPVKGAMFFARPEAARTSAGNLSFWGTHPPDEKRLATVIATKQQINDQVGLQKSAK